VKARRSAGAKSARARGGRARRPAGGWTSAEVLAFVERHGVVLQAAKGPVPSLAQAIAGGPIRGSWWAHPAGRAIFRATQALAEHPDVLVCKLVLGKVTYVHRRLWPALVRLEARFARSQLALVRDEHGSSGAHRSRRTAFPTWVPDEVRARAAELSRVEAEELLAPWLALAEKRKR
jgi:hypothetical protein